MTLIANTYLTTDPAWPWSLPGVGVSALLGVGLALAALTVWTYLGAQKATPRRITLVVVLRLLALAIALIVVLRPSLARDEEDSSLASRLLVLLDVSESMNVTDEFNNLSRYEHAKRLLTTAPVAEWLKRLSSERKIEIAYSMGAEDVQRLEFPAKPAGKRTDIGTWLHELWQQHGREPNLRGLVLLTDGADNGTRFAVLDKAAQFREVCPIHAFGLGRTDTTTASRDIAIDKIWAEPVTVHAKHKMTVKAMLAAPGFAGAVLKVSAWIEDADGKTMKPFGEPKAVDLRKLPDKIAAFTDFAPDKDGEVKVTVKVEPLPGETNATNNEASTFVNVSKEGVSILWVESKLRLETRFATRDALSKDGRLRVEHMLRSGKEAWPELDKRPFDVIVIGDISAQQFSGGNPQIFDKIMQLVQTKGMGLVMLGGYDAFAAGGWHQTKLASWLPARIDQFEQIDTKVKVKPTAEGERFLLRLAFDPAKQKELWATKLEPLDGMSPLGKRDPTATVHAVAESADGKQHEILVSVDRGAGRVMLFGGDTTYLAWRRSPEAVAAHETFWTQMMLWLAKRENIKGNLWVRPDTRRLELGKNERLGFTVNFTKGTGKVQQPKFTAKIVGPRDVELPVTILEEDNAFRGAWSDPKIPGEYRIMVEGEGIDDNKEAVSGKDAARFMVVDEDRENQRPAADHDLLQKIASASGPGGKFSLAEERKLAQFLEELPPLMDAGRASSSRWPDWRRNPASDALGDQTAALWQSSALPCLLAFCTLLCVEWFLRRRWGMV